VPVRSYRRPLADLLNALAGSGLVVDRVLEPLPLKEFEVADPDEYLKLMRRPGFLCVRAMKGTRAG
jgi:hypothetical protein